MGRRVVVVISLVVVIGVVVAAGGHHVCAVVDVVPGFQPGQVVDVCSCCPW